MGCWLEIRERQKEKGNNCLSLMPPSHQWQFKFQQNSSGGSQNSLELENIGSPGGTEPWHTLILQGCHKAGCRAVSTTQGKARPDTGPNGGLSGSMDFQVLWQASGEDFMLILRSNHKGKHLPLSLSLVILQPLHSSFYMRICFSNTQGPKFEFPLNEFTVCFRVKDCRPTCLRCSSPWC